MIQKPKEDSQSNNNVVWPRQKKVHVIYLATWNIQNLFIVNAVKELVNELKVYKGA